MAALCMQMPCFHHFVTGVAVDAFHQCEFVHRKNYRFDGHDSSQSITVVITQGDMWCAQMRFRGKLPGEGMIEVPVKITDLRPVRE